MKLLIDTHIYLWALGAPDKLSSSIRDALETPTNTVYVSSIIVAEIMIKASIGKLRVDFDPVAMAEETGFELLDFTANDASLLKDMPFHHRDPFDRMLVAQCISNALYIVTEDDKFKWYDCRRFGAP